MIGSVFRNRDEAGAALAEVGSRPGIAVVTDFAAAPSS